jgi:uridine kinase
MSSQSGGSSSEAQRLRRILAGIGIVLAVPLCTRALNTRTDSEPHDKEFAVAVKPITNEIYWAVCIKKMGFGKKVPIVIGISGPTGGGKTTFAQKLQTTLEERGIRARVLHGDDFLNPDPLPHAKLPHPHFDYLAAHHFFDQFFNGKKCIEKPAYVWSESAGKRVLKQEAFYMEGVQVMLFEGQYPVFDETTYDLNRLCDFHILLNPSTSLATSGVWKRGREISKVTDKEKYLSEVASTMEIYKSYLPPLWDKIRYVVIPDDNYKLVVQKRINQEEYDEFARSILFL